ncbi:hypothetical protein TSAR_011809 [Trichomalopsis sarcophagae]|uniref:C2H2-type domain-containing protein n=1 Tax=Trichomalopsis sarcophagae TaxID=543379 RepID=A0A232F525_9HYME|nr:hypothetical protein TSAR_011809 [Trichomalopsis sarcophagae]
MQEVHFIRVKEEVNVDADDLLPFEISGYIEDDYNTSSVADESTENSNRLEFKKYYAECGDQSVSPKEIDDLATLYDLIDFTCTKCRKTCKNADYFLMKTDLQCTDCQATMKFQCPRCKLLFRQFDSACRHARQNCQIDDDSVKSSSVQSQRKSQSTYVSETIRNCSACNFSTANTLELRRHFRHEHSNLLRSADSHVCWLCGRRYKSRESMLKHARLCGRPAHIRCQFCAYKTKRREHLRVHMRHRHPDPESCHGSTYDCPNCKKKYKYLTSMKSHAKNCSEAAATSTVPEPDE